MDFECHITIICPVNLVPQLKAAVLERGWTFSRITDDPILGVGQFCYATAHFDVLPVALSETRGVSMNLESQGYTIIRRKIESVLLDERCRAGTWDTETT